MAEIIVIHGIPGAGKTTLARRIVNYATNDLPVFHISAGDRLRAIRTGVIESTYANVINSSDAPSMLDHRIVNGLIFEFISLCPKNAVVLVDGYPRFPDATDVFLEAIKEDDHVLLGCLNLNISLETSIQRLYDRGERDGEGAHRSKVQFVEKRYIDHLRYTTNAIMILEKESTLINIDAEADVDTVWEYYREAFNSLVDNEGHVPIY